MLGSLQPGEVGAEVGATAPASLDDLASWLHDHYGPLCRFASLVCGDSHVGQDLVQEAFLNAVRSGVRIGPTTGAYFRRAIVNIWRSALRRRSVERRALERATPPSQTQDQTDPDPTWELIRQLPTRQRAVLALRYYEDFTERDTAATLGISIGSVKKHASRAISRLRASMTEEA